VTAHPPPHYHETPSIDRTTRLWFAQLAVLVCWGSLFDLQSRAQNKDGSSGTLSGTPEPEWVAGERRRPSYSSESKDDSRVLTSTSINLTFFTPMQWPYLEQRAVRRELDFTDEQIARLNRLERDWTESAAKQMFGLLDGRRPHERLDTSRMIADIKAILSEKQKTRLAQIILQHREATFGFPAVLPSVALDLELTDYQRLRLDAMHERHTGLVTEHLVNYEDAQLAFRSICEANRAHMDGVEQMLTQAQLTKLKELRGEPFRTTIQLNEPRRFRVPTAMTPTEFYMRIAWGIHAFEMEYLADQAIQAELKVTSEQALRIERARDAWHANLRNVGDRVAEHLKLSSNSMATRIEQLLTPAQSSRFHQIMIQQRMKLAGPGAACGYPVVAKALNLHKWVQDYMQRGEKVTSWLEEDQINLLVQLVGSPFKGEIRLDLSRLGDALFARRASPGSSANKASLPEYLLSRSTQLRLSEAQETRIRFIALHCRLADWALFGDLAKLSPINTRAVSFRIDEKTRKELQSLVFDVCMLVLDKDQRAEIKFRLLEQLGRKADDSRRDPPPSYIFPIIDATERPRQVERSKGPLLPTPRVVPGKPELAPPPREVPKR
jgi:hypothetical protein